MGAKVSTSPIGPPSIWCPRSIVLNSSFREKEYSDSHNVINENERNVSVFVFLFFSTVICVTETEVVD